MTLTKNSLVKKRDLNAKVTEVKSKIPNITGLATNSALTAVENKILDVSSLVKIHDQYVTTSKFNILTTKTFNARLAQGNLVTKTYFDGKLISLNKKTSSDKKSICLLKMNLKN